MSDRCTATHLKRNMAGTLRRAHAGHTVIVTYRGTPVAALVPLDMLRDLAAAQRAPETKSFAAPEVDIAGVIAELEEVLGQLPA